MKKEDQKIFYRPELAETLKEVLNTAEQFYSTSFRQMYYDYIAKSRILNDNNAGDFFSSTFVEDYADENTPSGKTSLFFKKIAECFKKDNHFGYEEFVEYYEKELKQEYHMELVSEARAAAYLYTIYKDVFDGLKDKIKNEISGPPLTKIENFMVEDFFRKITAPMRNPNITIPEGEIKCWYDRTPYTNFRHDLEESMKYITNDVKNTIEFFNTPDSEMEKDIDEIDF